MGNAFTTGKGILNASKDIDWDEIRKFSLIVKKESLSPISSPRRRSLTSFNISGKKLDFTEAASSEDSLFFIKNLDQPYNNEMDCNYITQEITGNSIIRIIEDELNSTGYKLVSQPYSIFKIAVKSSSHYIPEIPSSHQTLYIEHYTPVQVCKALYAAENRLAYDELLESCKIVEQIDSGVVLQHSIMKYPLISKRELYEYTLTVQKNNELYHFSTSANMEGTPIPNGIVRGENHLSCSKLSAENGITKVEMCSHVDLKLYSFQYSFAMSMAAKKTKDFHDKLCAHLKNMYG